MSFDAQATAAQAAVLEQKMNHLNQRFKRLESEHIKLLELVGRILEHHDEVARCISNNELISQLIPAELHELPLSSEEVEFIRQILYRYISFRMREPSLY